MSRLLVTLLLLCSLQTFAQTPAIDSLKTLLAKEKLDTTRVNLMNDISKELANTGDYENALKYANEAINIVKKSSSFAHSQSRPLGKTQRALQKGIAASLNNIGNVYLDQGNYPEALKNYLASLEIQEEIGDKNGIASSSNNIGTIYWYQGNYPEALKNYLVSLKIKEEIGVEHPEDMGNKKGIASSLNNIGNIYSDQGNYPEALKNYLASLKIKEEIGDKKGIAFTLNNIGNIFANQGNFPEALKNLFASLKIAEEIGDKIVIASTFNNIGTIYVDQSNYSEALKYIKYSLEIRKEIGDKNGIAISLGNIGDVYSKTGKVENGRNYILNALQLGIELGALDIVKKSYELLSQADSALGKHQSALENYKLYIIYRDSLLNEENTKSTIQQQMQYEFDKKEALTQAEQEKKDALALEELEKQKMQRNGFIGGFALMLLLAGVSYRSFRNKQKANLLLAHKNAVIEEKQKEIIDSINYAKRIQAAILPPQRIVKENLPESFILYKPKDIVAGDFYWMEQKDGKILFAAADCTGHGVPGAMVSVICNNGLNRSVREHGITDPGKILDKTREIVIQEFEKSDDEVKDGMDISLCSLKGNTLSWAGANNPLWIIRKNMEGEPELIEIKPDKQPIGKYAENKPFTTHSMELQKGDILYIFTDGYADQFGGEQGKKFKSATFKKLLISLFDQPMDKQKKEIEENFENWKGSIEQVDDVCVIGVRV
jgi:serine phosphatase RsbU (regulator of sigma subunit)